MWVRGVERVVLRVIDADVQSASFATRLGCPRFAQGFGGRWKSWDFLDRVSFAEKQIPFGNDRQKGRSRSFALLRMTANFSYFEMEGRRRVKDFKIATWI